MSDPAFKYTDATRRTVSRALADGRNESFQASAEEVVRWVAQGGVILAEDAPSQAQLDATARLSTDDTELSACKVDTTIMSLVNQTRAEWRTWAGSNFPTLTPAERTRLGDLFWVVSIGVRRSVRR